MILTMLQALCGEVTWVTADHAPSAPGQLGVRAGQQVELMDRLEPGQDLVLVRLVPAGLSEVTRPEVTQEGFVPVSCLKLPPSKSYQIKGVVDSDQGKPFLFVYVGCYYY